MGAALDGPTGPALDGPTGSALDGPTELALEAPTESELDDPTETYNSQELKSLGLKRFGSRFGRRSGPVQSTEAAVWEPCSAAKLTCFSLHQRRRVL